MEIVVRRLSLRQILREALHEIKMKIADGVLLVDFCVAASRENNRKGGVAREAVVAG